MMHTKTVKLDPETQDVLRRSTITADRVVLPEELDRDLYLRVDKALQAAGGKWNRKLRAHLFKVDPRETLGGVEDGTVVHRQQTLQRFDTRPEIADRLCALAAVGRHHRCLEPSAGGGAIVDAMVRAGATDVTAVDIDAIAYRELTAKGGPMRFAVVEADFLTVKLPGAPFDRIVMNPPFTKGQDARHVCHAFELLAPRGVLVSIISPTALVKMSKPYRALQQLVHDHGTLRDTLPRGSFDDTTIATAIIRLEKRT